MRFEDFMDLWIGTRYGPGQSMPGVGVDCIRLVYSWLLYREGKGPEGCMELPREAQDAALHDPKVCVRVRKIITDRFKNIRLERGLPLQTGDIVGVAGKGNPFHVGIVSLSPKLVLHSNKPIGVMVTSIQALSVDGYDVVEAYRPL